MQEGYAIEATALRREFNILDMPRRSYLETLGSMHERELVFGCTYRGDVAINLWKLENNFHMAKDLGSKFWLRENIFDYPSMNYIMREGPYTPPVDAQFGPEDKHVVLYSRGELWLVYRDKMFDEVYPVGRKV